MGIAKALSYLGEVGAEATLEALIEVLKQPDEALVAELGNLARLCEKTVTDLQILKLDKAALLRGDSETLDIDVLLGQRAGGRVPLSIVSTKFLGSESDVQFWVA